MDWGQASNNIDISCINYTICNINITSVIYIYYKVLLLYQKVITSKRNNFYFLKVITVKRNNFTIVE